MGFVEKQWLEKIFIEVLLKCRPAYDIICLFNCEKDAGKFSIFLIQVF